MAYNKLSLVEKIATKTRPAPDGDCLLWAGQKDAKGCGLLRIDGRLRRAHLGCLAEAEPFGYFKAEPHGWTDCSPDDDGAIALYERPQSASLAMPTADHSGDAANMVPTAASAIYYNASLGDFSLHHPDDLDGWVVYVPQPAAPVDERKLPPLPAAGIPDDQLQLDVGDLYTAKQMRDYARTALHSGADAKDAERYRWLADCNNFYEAIKLIADGSLTETALGAAIDASIAKSRGA